MTRSCLKPLSGVCCVLRSLCTAQRLTRDRCSFCAGLTTGTSARVRCLHPPGSTASAQAIVELRMPRDNRSRYFAGQWVFLCVPQLGLLHWHPFTIASEAADDELMLHVGAGGNWTTRLADLAKKQKHVKVRPIPADVPAVPLPLVSRAFNSYGASAQVRRASCAGVH